MAKLKNCFCTAILLLQFSASAQNIISGIVKDSSGKPISEATVLLYKINQAQIYKYVIAGTTGDFTFLIDKTIDSLTLKVNVLGYSKFDKKIANVSQTVIAKLSAEATTLPTITIKNLPITIKGDTTNYMVSQFSNKADRVIGDVIAKIPGIEIDGNGRITYNGKAISNYYIDGMDLLGSQYNIANTSIPNELVEQIQLLNKHQPIRLLDSLNTSTNVALNLKLKSKAKNKYIGKVKLGAGLSPLLWDNSLTILNFKKNAQIIANYKNNNTGESLGLELSENISAQRSGEESNADKEVLLSTIFINPPRLAVKRYLDNNSNLFSINTLKVLKNSASLRFTISAFTDKLFLRTEAKTIYYSPLDTFSITENTTSYHKENKINSGFNYLLNNPKIYINNNFKALIENSNDAITILNNGTVRQDLKTPYYKYFNELITKIKRRKNIYTINSSTLFSKTPQLINIFPGQFEKILNQGQSFSKLTQQATLSKFSTDNFLSTFFNKGKLYQEFKAGILYSSNGLNSDIETTQSLSADSLLNNFCTRAAKLYFVSNSIIKKGKKQVDIDLPVARHYVVLNNRTTGRSKSYQYWFFNPAINLLLPINSEWDFNIGYSKGNSLGSLNQTYKGYIINNYRTISRFDSTLPQSKINTFNSSLSYKNPLKGLYFFTNATFSYSRKNLLYTQQYNDGLINNIAIQKPNSQKGILIYNYLNKYFIAAKTNITLNYIINRQEGEQLLQGYLTKINLKSNEWKVSVKYGKSKWLNIDNTITLIKSKSKLSTDSKVYAPYFSEIFQERLRVNFFVSDKLFGFINTEYNRNKATQTIPRHYFFGDVGINYKFKIISVEATLNNVGNTKMFESVQLTSNYRQTTQYNLRPRFFLVKFYFNL